MTAATVKLIIELQDMVTSQLEKINAQMRAIEQRAKEVQAAMRQLDNRGLSRTTEEVSRCSNSLVKSTQKVKEFNNTLNQVKALPFSKVTQEAANCNTKLIETTGVAKQTADSFRLIDVNAKSVSTSSSSFDNLKSKISGVIPTTEQVKTSLSGLGSSAGRAFSGINIDGFKAKLSGLSGTVSGVKSSFSGMFASARNAASGLSQIGSSSNIAGGGLGFLRSAASMTVGMIGYDLVNSIAQSARESINASGNFQAFGKRMGMSASEIDSFSQHCDKLQQSFRKVDMKAVGASALELGTKLQLPKSSMEELTKTTAVMSSAFIKEGRTQTDAILAVSDALDGQFRRLQELGISQEMLKNNGWDGDINNKTSLLQAMNKTLDEMGFTETAMQVNTLDEAYQMLTVSGGQLLQSILVPITPALLSIIFAVVSVIDGIKNFVGQLQAAWNSLPSWAQEAGNIGLVTAAIIGLSIIILTYLVPTIAGALMGALTSFGSLVGVTIVPELATLSGAFFTVAGAVWAAIAPLLPFILAGTAIAVAIYEIGKAFGWWSDVGSMLDAIKNNIGRLWDAFINHPDVQALIKGIQDAWQGLNDFLKPVVDWLKGIWDEIFPPSAKGKVDGTRMVIDAIGMAFSVLKTILSPTISIIGGVISILGALWNAAQPVGQGIYNALKPIICVLLGCSPGIVPALRKVQEVFNTVFSAISGFIGGLVSSIISAIQPIIDFLSATFGPALEGIGQLLSGNIVGALGSFKESLGAVFDALGPVGDILESIIMPLFSAFIALLSGDANSAMTAFRGVWEGILDAMGPVGDFIGEYLTPVFYGLVNIFMAVWGAVQNIIGVFQAFLSGQISLPEALGQIWGIISQLFGTILQIIIQTVIKFAQNIWDKACTAGRNLLQGVITFVQQLPGKVWTWIVQTASKIIAGGARWVTNAKNKAHATVIGVMSYVNQLPGKVFNEFMNIGSKILQAGGALVEKAKKIGKDIVNGILNAMGIHSPGTIQKKVVKEFIDMIDRVDDKSRIAKESAKKVGDAIVDGFNKSDVEKQLNDVSSNVEFSTTDVTVPNITIPETGDNQNNDYNMIMEEVSLASASISESNSSIGDSFSNMTSSISADTSSIQTNVNGIVSSFSNTKTGVTNSLNSMKTNNAMAWSNITTSTQNNLNNIYRSTNTVTKQMTNAWNVMKNNIVNAANSIRTQSYAKFSSLHRTIASFYNQLASARFSAGLAAGPGSSSNISYGHVGGRTIPGGSVNFGRSVKGIVGKYAGGLGTGRGRFIDSNPHHYSNQSKESSSWLDLLDYNIPGDVMKNIITLTGCANPQTCFAGIPETHVSKIMDTAYKWRIGDPWFLGIRIPSDFHVSDFKDGRTPQLNAGNFESLLRKILTARGFQNPGTYEFYYNSKYSNQQVWDQVRCNCYDGAELICEIARMLGLSGHLIHGSWNGIGHMAAMVNGQIYDMTQFQKRGGIFRGGSGVSFGSASRGGSGSNDIFSVIRDGVYGILNVVKKSKNDYFNTIGSNSNNNIVISQNKDEVTLTIDHNLNLKIESDGEVELDKDSLLTTLKQVITDSRLVDKIAEALIKRDNKISRMKGVA